jgi:cytochrome c oxidase subunit 2
MDPRRPLRVLRRAVGPAVLAVLVLAGNASAGLIAPESGGGSGNAEDTKTLYWLIFALGTVVFLGVEGVMIWCLVKYRARKGRVAAQIHGNTRLEIGWTVGAAVILVFITVVTFIMLPGIKNPAASDIDANGNPVNASAATFASTDQPAPPGGASMNIQVDGQQYLWRYKYPGNRDVFSYVNMYVPVGMTVTLDISADDVAHSWWIPELGGKMDALPGYINRTWFKITEPGIYRGQCAELCGRNHANMYAAVIAMPFDRWQAWYDRQARDIQAAKDAAAEERRRLEAAQGEQAAQGGGAAGGAAQTQGAGQGDSP